MNPFTSSIAAAIYVLCGYIWMVLCLGTCTYLVFWQGHSGAWYILAMILCSGSIWKPACKIAGTWKNEYDSD